MSNATPEHPTSDAATQGNGQSATGGGQAIESLFDRDIHRRIEEVIKVDQTDEEIIHDEIDEYIVTDALEDHYIEILERYNETPNKPHEGIGIWVSGFFGSGKSSFAKMLGLALENRDILDDGAADLFAQKAESRKMRVLLSQIAENIPTDAVVFDVSTDRGIKSGSQRLTEIMYRQLLGHLGYAEDLDLAELEITLEGKGELERFKKAYRERFDQEWDESKDLIAFALGEASAVMHELYPDRFSRQDSWQEAMQDRTDISPGRFAERCVELMDRRRPGENLVFVVDEVGQFVSRNVQKMLDLQAIVQQLGVKGRGRFWLAVTSQEKLNELVSGLDDKKIELARLMDRFPLQVHLEPTDIAEVTGKRVLSKNAEAQKTLRSLYDEHRGRLSRQTDLTADIKLPELTAESFIDLYPLLPYQVDLVIQVVSGLRTQGGASKHVGGANRTIIKLAQQLLVHPDTNLAEYPVGKLARADQIYDLVSGNIPSEIRGKIEEIPDRVEHDDAQQVAKATCLLQYVQSIHRTAENIAAVLYPSVDAGTRLPQVKEALEVLTEAHQVRRGQDGYRIPSPVEDDWEKERRSRSPRPADARRIHAEVLTDLWAPQPSYTLGGTKTFRAGLFLDGREEEQGDLPLYLELVQPEEDFEEAAEEARQRSQAEEESVFWVARLTGDVSRLVQEVYRSKEILSRKERSARSRDEANLVREEKQRRRRHESDLRERLTKACLDGRAFFRGNDRSPQAEAKSVRGAAETLLGKALPEVFSRFEEAAAKVRKKDLEALMTMENLRGLPEVFSELNLLEEKNGTPVFRTGHDPLAEVRSKIKNRTDYGESANGRYLEDVFAKEPYGWDFDTVRLFVVSLLRAGKIEATSKGQLIDQAVSLKARDTFTKNNLFRQASFRPHEGLDQTKVIEAYTHFKDVYGHEVQELEEGAVSRAIRDTTGEHEDEVRSMHTTLAQHDLPGQEVLRSALEQMQAIRTGPRKAVILTFNGAYREIKEAIQRTRDLKDKLNEPRLKDIRRARSILDNEWTFLRDRDDVDEEVEQAAERLKDLLKQETFYRNLAEIDQLRRTIEEAHQERFEEAAEERIAAYEKAIEELQQAPDWGELSADQQQQVAEPLQRYTSRESAESVPIVQLQTETEACSARLDSAMQRLTEMADNSPVVRIKVSKHLDGSISSEEQLNAALEGLRKECLKQIGAGKKVLLR